MAGGSSDTAALALERQRSADLEAQLQEALELLEAIRTGDVDAVVVGGRDGRAQVYTLRDADRPYRLLIEEMQEGAMTLSLDGVVLYANKSLTSLLGMPDGSIVGRQFRDFVVQRDEHQRRYDRLLSGGKGDLTLAESRGAEVHVQFSVNTLEAQDDGDQQILCVVVTDLSEEKQRAAAEADAFARAASAESEARLKFTVRAGRLGVWQLDLVTGELTTSPMCRLNFGRDLGQPFTYEELRMAVHPDDRTRMLAAVEHSIESRTDYDIEYRIVTPEGDERWVQIRAQPAYAEDGTPLHMAGISLDVTDRRRAEQDLQRLNETLETRVKQEVATRVRAEDLLRQSQKLEAVGQLTGGVAHDFNNLLTIIKSSTDLLRRPGLAEERRNRYIGAIAETVERAAKLTGQLLAFARRSALKPEVFDVPERMRGIADMMRTIVGSRVRLATEFACERAVIEADVSQFETALVNMAVNARDAMEGNGKLTVSVATAGSVPAIRAHASAQGAFVVLKIADTGIGIPADKLEQIFEPFFTTKEVGKGTGLGLSQVYGFAKQSGGDIEVHSEVGKGTTFTLYLPLVAREVPRAVAALPLDAGANPGPAQRVLVVEDNVDVGAFSTQLLQDLGYQTTWAASGGDALELLYEDARRFDVVFTDVVMPGMSGVELGEEIRRRHPGLPVVLTSGYSHVLAEKGRHGFELVQKPYAVDEVSRILRRVLSARV